ncbi:MAG: dihydropteroate synthase [Jannaschia sp.]
MTHWLRPLPAADARPDALCIAGGPVRFTHVERLERGRPAHITPVTDLDPQDLSRLAAPRAPICGIDLSVPRIMGIINVTPDSFSDGGRFLSPVAAARQVTAMARADILDIGGESTRPGAALVPPEEEIARILPVIAAGAERCISVDTRKASVASAALAAGARIVNDVSGGTFDPDLLATVAASGAPVCLMHSVGTPVTMQDDPSYDDVLFDVLDALAVRIAAAEAAGISRDRIIADPGIGFGKTRAHNLALLRRIGVFHDLGVPILLGVSRKRFIGDIGRAPQADDRLPGTLAVTLAAVAQGIQIHRVHDVAEVAQGLALWAAVTGGE